MLQLRTFYANNFPKESIALSFRQSGYFVLKESKCSAALTSILHFFCYQLSPYISHIKTEAVVERFSLVLAKQIAKAQTFLVLHVLFCEGFQAIIIVNVQHIQLNLLTFFLTCKGTYEMPENKKFSFKDWAKKSHHRGNI